MMLETSFNECKFQKCEFQECSLEKADFFDTSLKDIDLSTCDISGIRFTLSSLKGVILAREQCVILASIFGVYIKE